MLAYEMREAGFVDVSFERLSLGIVAIHVARKPVPGEKNRGN
jgi:ubiquinone/menaquinone biosynthesis C-methylase UbiE